MDNFDNHFLDSNIIIGSILHWDKFHEKCSIYLTTEYTKRISERVYGECETVFNRLRRGQKKFLGDLISFMSTKNLQDYDRNLNIFLNRFIRDKADYFDLPQDKFREIMTNFVKECYDDIKQGVMGNSGYLFSSEIDEAFNGADEELNRICLEESIITVYSGFPELYNTIYPGLTYDLTSLGLHNSDVLIVIDCYHLKEEHIKRDHAFITSDGTILKCKNQIEQLLQGVFVHPLS